MRWKLMKLGELLRQSKELSVSPDVNRRIRVRLNVGGVEKRPVSNEVEGATNYYTRKAGQFIFGTQNFHKGAFGIIPPELDGFETSNDIPSFYVSKESLPEWIFFYFKVGDRYKELEKLARGVGSKRVHPTQIFELRIPVPPVAEQLVIIEQVQISAARQHLIVSELDRQLSYLTQLRQALLREAMQGRLLPQDPTDQPAADLLRQLTTAKATTGKGGKGRAGTLFGAEAVEGPHMLPRAWRWCKLKDLVECSDSGWSPACTNHPAAEGVWGVLKTTSVQKLQFLANENKQLPDSLTPRPQYEVKAGDILVTRAGPKNRVGVCCVVSEVRPKLMISDKLIRLHLHEQCASPEFIALALNIGVSAQFLEEVKTGMADSQVNISQDNLRATIIPLPPLAEQRRIVAKLDQLLAHCDALEQRIGESRRLAGQLLQAALREALAGPGGEVEAEAVEAAAPVRAGTQLRLDGLG